MEIDWSNPTIQGVLVAGVIGLIGVIVAAVAGVLGAALGARIGANAARESARISQAEAQANRDDARHAREVDRRDAKLDRFADRKLALAVDLLLAADVHAREAGAAVHAHKGRWYRENVADEWEKSDPIEVPSIGSSEGVRAASQAFDIVAPDVAPAADALYQASVQLGLMAAYPNVEYRDPAYDSWNETWKATDEHWTASRDRFVQAVRADLGVVPVPTQRFHVRYDRWIPDKLRTSSWAASAASRLDDVAGRYDWFESAAALAPGHRVTPADAPTSVERDYLLRLSGPGTPLSRFHLPDADIWLLAEPAGWRVAAVFVRDASTSGLKDALLLASAKSGGCLTLVVAVAGAVGLLAFVLH